jgi:hypothetical protein
MLSKSKSVPEKSADLEEPFRLGILGNKLNPEGGEGCVKYLVKNIKLYISEDVQCPHSI